MDSILQPLGYQLRSLSARLHHCGLDWHLVSEANDLCPLWGWAGCSERDKCDGRTDEERLCDDLSVSTEPLLFFKRVHLPGWHLLGTRGQPATLSPVLAGRAATVHTGSIHKWMLISPATGNQCCQAFLPLWGQTAPAPTKTLLDKMGSLNTNEHQCFLQNF